MEREKGTHKSGAWEGARTNRDRSRSGRNSTTFSFPHLSHLLFESKPTNPSFTRGDHPPGTSPLTMEGGKDRTLKTGLKMEEKSKKLQALWTHNNNIALHPNCHCTCSLPTALKTFLSSLFLALFHLARSRWTLDLRI